MAKRQFNRLDVTPQQAGWDATVNTNFERVEELIEDYPWPVYETTGALPAAGSNDRALAFKDEGSGDWSLYYSDGTTWQLVTRGADTYAPKLALSKSAESADNIDFTIQVTTPRDVNFAKRVLLDVWIGTAQWGAPAGTQTVTVQTGTLIQTVAANQHIRVQTDATGKAVIRVNVAGAATRWLMAAIAGDEASLDGTWAA